MENFSRDKKVAEVRKTTDYGKFKILPGNRDVSPKQVKRIADTMKKKGYIPAPIIVNKDFEIIDGQHRFSAAKMAGVPVLYIVATDAKGMDARKMMYIKNQNQRNWSLREFEQSYCRLAESGFYGNRYDDYLAYRKFRQKWNLSYAKGISLLGRPGIGIHSKVDATSGGFRGDGGGPNDIGSCRAFRNGEFRVLNLDYAERVMQAFHLIKDICPEDVFKSSTTLDCYIILMRNERFLPEVFAQKLKRFLSKNPGEFKAYKHRRDMLRQIERVYNYESGGDYVDLLPRGTMIS